MAPVAPIQMVSIYGESEQPLDRAREATHNLARLVDAAPAADALLEQVDAAMAEARQRLRAYDGRPLYVIGFIDEQHVAVATRGSLFQDVLDQLGLHNAWQGQANCWGAAVVGVESLLPGRWRDWSIHAMDRRSPNDRHPSVSSGSGCPSFRPAGSSRCRRFFHSARCQARCGSRNCWAKGWARRPAKPRAGCRRFPIPEQTHDGWQGTCTSCQRYKWIKERVLIA